MATRHPRIPCVILGCRCGSTSHPPGYEIICPKHYRLVDRSLKALRRRVRATLRRKHHFPGWRRRYLEAVLWRKMVRQAQERAAGI